MRPVVDDVADDGGVKLIGFHRLEEFRRRDRGAHDEKTDVEESSDGAAPS
jgi:hypothetical protein